MLFTGLFLFYLIGFSCAASYNTAFYEGRSGDIIVQHDDVIEDSVVMFSGEAFSTLELKELKDTQYADLFAHVFGMQSFNALADREGFPRENIFNKPKVGVIFTVDSVGTAGATLNNYKRAELTTSTYPPNSFSFSSNLATGTEPQAHGIVGASWMRGEVDVPAFSMKGTSLRASVADILSQEFDGKSLIVSGSSSLLSGAFAVHPSLKNSNTRAYSLHGNVFASLYEGDATIVKVLDLLKNSDFIEFVGANPSSFDMDTREDFVLFAELGFVYNLIHSLQSDPAFAALTKDNVPDLLSFAFSSLKGIQTKYGESSEKYAQALSLVNNVIQRATAAISEIYNGRIAATVFYLNTRLPSHSNLESFIYSIEGHNLYNDFEKYYPTIYLRGGFSEVCPRLEAEGLSVYCSVRHAYARWSEIEYAMMMDSLDNPANTTITNNWDVPAFWIIFWISFIIFLFILGGVYGLVAIGEDASKDSLLYRSAGHLHQS